MTGRIENIEIWDGKRALGSCRLEWTSDDRDGTISAVTPAAGADEAPGPEADWCVIPGLIDTHVHLIGYAGPGRVEFLTWPLITRPEEQVLHGLAHARAALAGGVTTLRDLSADEIQFSLARAVNAGIVSGPRLLAYGMVSMTAGHGDLFTPPAFPHRKPTADGPDACRRLVREWARAGADGIKIATSGGVLSVGDKAVWRNHTPAEIDAIVEEAHALALPVAAHAHTAAGIEVALAAGVDSIEHGTLMTAEQGDRIAAAGTTVAPTLMINDRIAAGQAGSTAEQAAKARELVAVRDQRLGEAAAAGVDFVLGTDANGHHVAFGDQMVEVRQMAQVFGWTAERALVSATSAAAAALGRAGSLGRIQAGSAADFVVLRGRPWHDLRDLDPARIVAVVSRGRVVSGSLDPLGPTTVPSPPPS